MSSIRSGRSHIELTIDDRTRQGTQAAQKNLQAYADNVASIGRRLFVAGGIGTGIGVGLLAPLKSATIEAGNFNEEVNRFEATFGANAKSVRQFAQDYSKAINRFEGDTLRGLSSFAGFLQGLEFGDKEVVKLSKDITQLSEDFGSFFPGIGSELARIKILGALGGESEGVKDFGINVKVAALDQEFLREGLDITNQTATEQQKVLTRLAIIYRALSRQGAVGDAVKTANQFINSQRGVEAQLKSVRVAAGQALIPIRTEWNKTLIGALQITRDFIAGNQLLVISYAKTASAIAAGGVVVAGAGGAFIGLSAAMRLLGRSAETAAAPVTVATGAAATGTAQAARGATFLGSATKGALDSVVSLGVGGAIAAGSILRGFGALLPLLGGVGGAVVGVAGAFALLDASSRPIEKTTERYRDLASILFSVTKLAIGIAQQPFRLAEALGISDALDKLIKLSRIYFEVLSLGKTLEEGVLAVFEITNPKEAEAIRRANAKKDQSNGARVLRDASGVTTVGAGETVSAAEIAIAKAKRASDSFLGGRNIGEALGDALGFEDIGNGLARLDDGRVVDLADAKLESLTGGLKKAMSSQLDALDFPSIVKLAEEEARKVQDAIEKAGGVSGKGFGGGNLLPEIESLLAAAQGAEDGVKKSSRAISARGTFGTLSAANLALGRAGSGDKIQTLVKQTTAANKQRERIAKALEDRPVLRFG